jgi:very-short-patch-repair endonuclease
VVARIAGPRGRLLTGGALLSLGGIRKLQPSGIELLVRPQLSVAPRPGVYVHRGAWVAGDRVIRVQGIPSAPWLRAVTDAARRASVDRLMRDIAALDRLRKTTPAQAAAYLSRRGRFPGRPKMVEALALLGVELVHSRDEAAARAHLRAAELVVHPRPLLIMSGQRRIGEVDIPVCAVRYGAEVDGPHHDEDEVAQADRRRDRRLETIGWDIERFRHDDVRSDPAAFVRAVQNGVAAQAARGVMPWPCERCRT